MSEQRGLVCQTPNGIDTKIAVLLSEYSTLRDEVLQRDTALNQVLTVAGASVVGVVTIMLTYSLQLGTYLLIFLLLFSYWVFRLIEFDTLHIAKRLLELEADINERTGERLLVWETNHGLFKVSYAPRFWYAFRALLGFAVVVIGFVVVVGVAAFVLDAYAGTHIIGQIMPWLQRLRL